MKISNRLTKCLAALMLAFMLSLAFFSMRGDSAIMDEVAHLPAGYSYVTQKDMRLNPEHPPLIKDLAGGAVLLWSKIANVKINFPSNIKAWTQDINGQWDFGFDFLYKEGNPADSMLFVGRLPMLLVLLVLGIYIFMWTKQLWGKRAALLALFLFSFSPTFIAHGRFVTTDVAAAAAFFISSYYFIRWLRNPGAWRLICAGIFFGLAQLAKFSLFLIVPFFGLLVIVWIAIKLNSQKDPKIKKERPLKIICRQILGFVVVLLIGYALVVTPVYCFHVKNYPVEKQTQDMKSILASYAGGAGQEPLAACTSLNRITRCPAELVIWTADKPLPVRAFGQYMFGLLMVVQRASGGNTTYFMGEVSSSGWKSYFPTVYLLKEPLALHILTFLTLSFVFWRLLKRKVPVKKDKSEEEKKPFIRRLLSFLNLNFETFAMLTFIVFYWVTSIRSTLNIGVRHVLPTFPFIYALVSSQVISWMRIKKAKAGAVPANGNGARTENRIYSALKYTLVFLLVIWQACSILAIYPSYLTYFNEIVGGAKNGYKYVADSNLDWGQDLKRLESWTDENKIEKIYVEYFGGATVEYYLDGKFQPWWGTRDPADLKSGDYLAISATLLQGGRGKPAPGYTDKTGYYNWLNDLKPVTTIGYSIFVYKIP